MIRFIFKMMIVNMHVAIFVHGLIWIESHFKVTFHLINSQNKLKTWTNSLMQAISMHTFVVFWLILVLRNSLPSLAKLQFETITETINNNKYQIEFLAQFFFLNSFYRNNDDVKHSMTTIIIDCFRWHLNACVCSVCVMQSVFIRINWKNGINVDISFIYLPIHVGLLSVNHITSFFFKIPLW